MSSALLVSSSPSLIKTSCPVRIPHSVSSSNVFIRPISHPSLTRRRYDNRTYARAGEKGARVAPIGQKLIATVLATTIFVSSSAFLPAVAAIDWQSLAEPSSAPEERAKLLKLVLDQKQAEKEERLREEKEAKKKAAAAPPLPPVIQAAAVPAVREPVAPAQTPVPVQGGGAAPEVSVIVKPKTHGFLPLFLAQFLFLGAYAGGGFAVLNFPDAKWAELMQKVDSALEKASPSIVSAWEKSQPVLTKVFATTQKLAADSVPYVVKAAEAAKPLAERAVEAVKPLVAQGKEKVEELIQTAKEKAVEAGKRKEEVGKELELVGESVKAQSETPSGKVGGGAQLNKEE